jgi:hypothetical protein
MGKSKNRNNQVTKKFSIIAKQQHRPRAEIFRWREKVIRAAMSVGYAEIWNVPQNRTFCLLFRRDRRITGQDHFLLPAQYYGTIINRRTNLIFINRCDR